MMASIPAPCVKVEEADGTQLYYTQSPLGFREELCSPGRTIPTGKYIEAWDMWQRLVGYTLAWTDGLGPCFIKAV